MTPEHHPLDRVEVRMGRLSFACDASDLDRQLRIHEPMARRSGWAAEPIIAKLGMVKMDWSRSLDGAAKGAASKAAKARARWSGYVAQAESWPHLATISNRCERRARDAVRFYHLTPPFDPTYLDRLTREWERLTPDQWREVFDRCRGRAADAARAVGCSYDAAKIAAGKYGIETNASRASPPRNT